MILVGRASEEELLNLAGRRHGSLVAYFGYVRDFANGKSVTEMMCSETEESKKILRDIEKEILATYPVKNIILYHSVGKLNVGELLAAVIVSTVHREEGFKACMMGIDRIKEKEPVERREY